MLGDIISISSIINVEFVLFSKGNKQNKIKSYYACLLKYHNSSICKKIVNLCNCLFFYLQ